MMSTQGPSSPAAANFKIHSTPHPQSKNRSENIRHALAPAVLHQSRWTIGYGLVQAIAPSVIRRSPDGLSREVPEARLWGVMLTAIPLALAVLLGATHVMRLDLLVTVGLGVFGFAFAVISSLHSYLILAYAGSAKAAEDVGFYYAANAGGRLIGILLSGALTQAGGLEACLWGSAILLTLCLAITFLLPAAVPARRVTVA